MNLIQFLLDEAWTEAKMPILMSRLCFNGQKRRNRILFQLDEGIGTNPPRLATIQALLFV